MIVETKRHDEVRSASSIEDLYRLYHRKLIHFFTGKGLEWEVAEDLSQEVFFRFLRCDKSVESQDHARNLLYRIAQNLVIDHFRKHNGNVRVRALSPDDLAEELPYMVAEEMGPEDRLINDETSQDIRSAVSRLPLRYAQAIMLKEYDGLSYREIAAHMGVSQKAVESLLYRAKSQLKEDLAERGRKRGGWWSGILLGLRGMRERAVNKPLRALGRKGWKWQGASVGLGSAGMGKGVLNIIAIILLLGSVAGTGVAATVSACRDTAAVERGIEDIQTAASSEDAALSLSAGAVFNQPARDKGAEREEGSIGGSDAAAPALMDTTLAAPDALLAKTGDALRGAITSAGSGLDLLLAGLGQLLGSLTDPLAFLLFYAGVPPLVLDTLAELASLETARDLAAGLVDGAVEATHILDGTVGLLPSLPTVQLLAPARPTESSEGESGETAGAPGEPSSGGTTAGPAVSAPVPEPRGIEPETTQAESETGVEDVTGGVGDLLDNVIDVVKNLLPF